MRKILIIQIILLMAVQTVSFAQTDTAQSEQKDTLSAAAKSDSAAAAYKIEALRQALGGDSYQPAPPITDNFQPPDFGRVAVRMAVGLGVILVLLYAIYILIRKARNIESVSASSGQSVVKLLDSKFFGGGKSMMLVKVGVERILVVGSYTDGMRTLSEIHGEEARRILEMYDAKPVTAAQFSATVDHLLRRFKKEEG